MQNANARERDRCGGCHGTASLTYAATATGKITDINQTKHLIALDTGSKFSVPASSLGDRQPAKLE
jgi:hypothetical protein